MMNLYCISGLGADKRVFAKLDLQDVSMVHFDWPVHDENDTLSSYALKVSALIAEDDPVILGVSFGGMLAVEIAKVRPVKKVVIVSSAKDSSERPFAPWIVKQVINSGIVPLSFYTWPNIVLYKLFSTETEEDRKLLKNIILDSDARLVKWAISAILSWDNEVVPDKVVHIHGKVDRMITPRDIQADEWIDDGGHMMIYNRAEQVSSFVQQQLDNIR